MSPYTEYLARNMLNQRGLGFSGLMRRKTGVVWDVVLGLWLYLWQHVLCLRISVRHWCSHLSEDVFRLGHISGGGTGGIGSCYFSNFSFLR